MPSTYTYFHPHTSTPHYLRQGVNCQVPSTYLYVQKVCSQTQYVMYVFFWVFPLRPIVIFRRFGTLYQFHLQGLDVKYEVLQTLHPALENGTDRVFRNVGIQQSDAGEIPKKIHTRFKTRRKFEIKNVKFVFTSFSSRGYR